MGALGAWALAALAMIVLAAVLGHLVTRRLTGVLIDQRGRYSLTQTQLVVWSIIILSLIAAFVTARVLTDKANPMGFEIPRDVWGVLGISIGSTVLATATKTAKDNNPNLADQIAASNAADRPRLSQIFTAEEGALADKVIDVTKFQNFILTAVLVASYLATAISELSAKTPSFSALPAFSADFLVVLGISHAGYIAGKIPNKAGTAPGLTVRQLSADPEVAPPSPRNASPTGSRKT